MEGWAIIIIIKDHRTSITYSIYIHDFKSKYNFFNRTFPTIQNNMKSAEFVLRSHSTPAITGELSISEHLRQHIALTLWPGGMAVTIPCLNTKAACNTLRLLTEDIVDHIKCQNTEHQPNKERIKD